MVKSVTIGDLPTTTEITDSDSLIISSSSDGVTRQITKLNLFGELTEDVGDILENGTRSIIPALDSSYDLGSPSKKWRNLYLSGTISGGSLENINSTSIGFTYDDSDAVTRNLREKLSDGYISVKDFGATGDGSTDDTTAIQNAINHAAEVGKTVYIPAGHYMVTTLYDHWDSDNNPGFPTQASTNQAQGRLVLTGEKPTNVYQMQGYYLGGASSTLRGSMLETSTTTGPLFVMGNNLGVSDPDTTRATQISNLSFYGGDSCSDVLLKMNDLNDGAKLENMHFYLPPTANAGDVIRLEGRSYFNEFTKLRISGGSRNLVLGQSEADLFQHLDMSGARNTGVVVQESTNSVFRQCQVTGAENGVDLGLSGNVLFDRCWFENQDGLYDLKAHRRAQNVHIDGCLFTSTALNKAHVLLGGDTGNLDSDRCSNVLITNTMFNHVGSRNANDSSEYAGAIYKYGTCERLHVENCSFDHVFGYAVGVDVNAGVTPTTLKHLDWQDLDADSDFDTSKLEAKKIVEFNDNIQVRSAPWLGRGTDLSKKASLDLTSNLDMTTWKHLPSILNVNTSGGSVTVTLPEDSAVADYYGETISIRKTSASNTLTVNGAFYDSSSRSITDAVTETFMVTQDGYLSISDRSDGGGAGGLDSAATIALIGMQNKPAGNNSIQITPDTSTLNADNNNIIIGTQISDMSGIGPQAVAMGYDIGAQANGVSIGYQAGAGSQSSNTGGVFIGSRTNYFGNSNPADYAIAIGHEAGAVYPGVGSIALGASAGKGSSGDYTVAIGYNANTTSSFNNTIMIKADGSAAYNSTAQYDIDIRTSAAGSLTYDTTNDWTFGAGVTMTDLTASGATVVFSNLPTADPTNAGQLWRDSDNGNVLKVSVG